MLISTKDLAGDTKRKILLCCEFCWLCYILSFHSFDADGNVYEYLAVMSGLNKLSLWKNLILLTIQDDL